MKYHRDLIFLRVEILWNSIPKKAVGVKYLNVFKKELDFVLGAGRVKDCGEKAGTEEPFE